jgi:hypothetical protein
VRWRTGEVQHVAHARFNVGLESLKPRVQAVGMRATTSTNVA